MTYPNRDDLRTLLGPPPLASLPGRVTVQDVEDQLGDFERFILNADEGWSERMLAAGDLERKRFRENGDQEGENR